MDKLELLDLIQNYLIQYPEDKHGVVVKVFLESNDNFWQRENQKGHITASAWVVNKSHTKTLLTHHKKLNIWVQLGGHIEDLDISIYDACKRELKEESGLKSFQILSKEIFDIDVHKIPENKLVAEHLHYDIRLLFEADDSDIIHFNLNESNDVKWIDMKEIKQYSEEESVLRMVVKISE